MWETLQRRWVICSVRTHLRQSLLECEEGPFVALHNILSSAKCPMEGEDSGYDLLSQVAPLSSFFLAMPIRARTSSRSPKASIWKVKASTRVIVFGWLVLRGSSLTMDNLWWWKKILVNAFPMCLGNEETVNHLLNCKVACPMCSATRKWWTISSIAK